MNLDKDNYTEDEFEEMSRKDIEAIERRLDKMEEIMKENKQNTCESKVTNICSILSIIMSVAYVCVVIYQTGYYVATLDRRLDSI